MISSAEFGPLFDKYYPKLYAYLRSQVADRETAEDISATAFERAFSRSHQFDAAKASFATWLFRIGRNLVLDHYAAVSRKPVLYDLNEVGPVSAGGLSPEQQLLQQEQLQLLLDTMATLPARDQEIIRLRFFGQLTNRRIAEVMEIKEKTISVIILRALRKIKAGLRDVETA